MLRLRSYHSVTHHFSQLLDKHAPATISTRRIRTFDVWFTNECRVRKRRTRQLEKQFKLNKSGFKQTELGGHTASRYIQESEDIILDKQSRVWIAEVMWKSQYRVGGNTKINTEPVPFAIDFANLFASVVETIRASTASAPPPLAKDNSTATLSPISPRCLSTRCISCYQQLLESSVHSTRNRRGFSKKA